MTKHPSAPSKQLPGGAELLFVPKSHPPNSSVTEAKRTHIPRAPRSSLHPNHTLLLPLSWPAVQRKSSQPLRSTATPLAARSTATQLSGPSTCRHSLLLARFALYRRWHLHSYALDLPFDLRTASDPLLSLVSVVWRAPPIPTFAPPCPAAP
ncbi:uncharacterized protein PSFLO_01482 [Pseudozyma flocculosa]|uniref:Uncharacterized protein n=1 Tax=Pseudozyma flocculosa TaxID=84751 RepID=A0A5C3EY85_9BASI|nr:uncharacterized protein PSFLO_01482 [Pseudozyma flocculosa]